MKQPLMMMHYLKMGSGPALVLLHGFPENSSLWSEVWEALAQEFTLIIPDLPGAGKSAADGYESIDDYATGIRNILDKEGMGKAIIAGHSMGGYTAFAFSRLFPGRVAGLVAIHSIPGADSEEKKITRAKTIQLIRKGDSGKSAFISQMIPNLFANSFKLSHPEIIQQQMGNAMEVRGDNMIGFYQAMMERTDNTQALKNAPFPVQWIVGMEDNVIDYRKILEVCHLSGINFVTFYHNCGHMSMLENPVKLIGDLRAFGSYCSRHHYA